MRGGSTPNQIEQPAGEAEADLDGGDVDKAPDKGTDPAGSYVDESLEEGINLNNVGLFEELYANKLMTQSSEQTPFGAVQSTELGTASAENTHSNHPICGDKDCKDTTHKNTGEWTAWDSNQSNNYQTTLPSTAGYYYLTDNVDLSAKWEPANGVVLCLNGNRIVANGKFDAISVDSGVTFTLTDCKPGGTEGQITHGLDETSQSYISRGVDVKGIFNLYDGSITGNDTGKQANPGGGVVVDSGEGYSGTFNMYGGKITGNTASSGGGVLVSNNGTFTMEGGEITDNTAYGTGTNGGGGVAVDSSGTFNMYGGKISGNTTDGSGGGVAVMYGGQFTMSGGSITGNKADNATTNGSGGGVYVYGAAAVDNTEHKSSFTMSGSASIAGNTAKSGGGVYVSKQGTFAMNGGTIGDRKGNEATNGGGVYVEGGKSANDTGNFTMSGGSITGNTADSGSGGVYVGGRAIFTMTDGSITGNEAKNSNGGGVYVFGGTFYMFGNAGITGNKASRHGGGVYVTSSGSFAMSNGTITGNKADASGGGVFVEENTTFTMSGGSITGNDATTNGGGVYVGYDITVSGTVHITGNCKGGTKSSDSNVYTGGSASNVYLRSSKTIDASGLEANAGKIGVTTADKPAAGSHVAIATGAKDGTDYSSIFTPDVGDQDYTITSSDGNVYLNAHKHSWTYTANNNNTITAKCNAAGCPLDESNGGSVTINAPADADLTYDGNAKAATLDTTTGNWQGETVSEGNIKYKKGETTLETAPTNAGEYTASITLGDAEASVTYTIAKATPTVNWQGYSYGKSFTGSAIANPTSSDIQIHDGKNNTLSLWDSVTFKWYKATKDANGTYTKADNNALEANPIDAGDYIIEAVFVETDNTDAATVEKGLTIAKAQDIGSGKSISKDVEVILTSAQREYSVDLDELLKENNINYGGDLEVNTNYLGITVGSTWADSAALEGNTLKITMKSLTGANAGVLGTINANLTSKNYNVISFVFNLKAVAKPEKALDVTMDGWTYGNTANSPVYKAPQNTTETTVTYTRKDGTAVTGVPTDAGEYKVTVKCETDTEVYIGTTDFEIAKRKVNISGFTGVDKVYDGTTNASVNCDNIVFENKLAGDELTFTVNKAQFTNANVGDKKTITFGNGYTFGGASAANYEIGTLQNSMPAKITKKEITFAYGYVGIKKYDGTVTARIFEPKIEGLVGEEKLTSGTDYTVSAVFDSADVGDKNVTITVILNDTEATSNYQWKDGKESYVENTTLKDGIYKGDGGKFGSVDGTAELTLRYTDTTEHRYKIDTSLLPKGQNWTLAPTSGKVHCWIDSTTNELVYKNSTGKAGETFDATITAQCSNYNNWTHNVTIRLTDRDEQTGFAFEDNTSSVTKTYGDAEVTVKASGQVTGSNVTYSSSDENVAIVDKKTGEVHIIGAGTATIYATASETADYNAKTVSYTLTVNKKQITAPTADSTEYTYNGKEQTYKLAENEAYTITNNTTQTNANENGYTITVSLKNNANTQWSDGTTADKTYKFVIHKQSVNAPAEDVTVYTYNGKEQTYKLAEDEAYTINGNKQTKANENGYAVTVALKDKANTQWADNTTDDKAYSFVIKKATVTITVKDKTAYVKGTAPDLSAPDDYTVSGLIESDTLITLPTLKYIDADNKEITPDMTKTGEYIINAGGADAGDNYTISYKDGKLTVKNKTTGGHTKKTEVVTKDKVTTSPAEVKTDETGTATATVTDANQKEIIKQAKDNKSEEIVINVSEKDIANGADIKINLDKEFIDSIVNDTDAKLTIRTPEGDRTFTKEELKKLSENSSEGKITISPSDDDLAIAKAKELTAKLNLTARSSKTAKGNIKVVLKNSTDTKDLIKELKELGFTVKYRFYRSTKKTSGYKSTVTKDTDSYTNTTGKKGTKYYYKVRVMVYDADGSLIVKSDLKQCRYASRTWSK